MFVDMEEFAEVVRKAVVDTFVRLDNDWITVGHMAGEPRQQGALGLLKAVAAVQRHCRRWACN